MGPHEADNGRNTWALPPMPRLAECWQSAEDDGHHAQDNVSPLRLETLDERFLLGQHCKKFLDAGRAHFVEALSECAVRALHNSKLGRKPLTRCIFVQTAGL